MKEINEIIERITPYIIEIRRDIHMHPELSQQEYRTCKLVTDHLQQWGICCEAPIADTGVLGIIVGGMNDGCGKTVALRADMDALPIKENNIHLDYCSVNEGVMHACGHDVHTAILLGAAKVLSEIRDELPGNVKFFFQPAEETVGGAERMIAAGCMQNPKVDYALGLHIAPEVEAGHIALCSERMNASANDIYLTINGTQAHGAYPHRGIDAIVIAASIITGLQSLVSRHISPLDSVVLTFGSIEGGKAGNIICNQVKVHGTLRATTPQLRDDSIEYIKRFAALSAEAFGGECLVEAAHGYAPLINHNEIVNIIDETAHTILPDDCIHYIKEPSMGAEDFSFFIENTPGAFYNLGSGNIKKGYTASVHTADMQVDESCIPLGIRLQVELVLRLMKEK